MAVRMREVLVRPWVGRGVRLSCFLLCNGSLVKKFLPVAITFNLNFYYMAETISEPDKANPAFVATQGGKKAPSCPLGMYCVGPAGKSSLFRSLYWPRSFVAYLLTETSSIRRDASQKWTRRVGS